MNEKYFAGNRELDPHTQIIPRKSYTVGDGDTSICEPKIARFVPYEQFVASLKTLTDQWQVVSDQIVAIVEFLPDEAAIARKRYAIILPTLQAHYNAVKQMVDEVFK